MRFAIAQICIGCTLLLVAVFAATVSYDLGRAAPACFALISGAFGGYLVDAGDGDLQDQLDLLATRETNLQDE